MLTRTTNMIFTKPFIDSIQFTDPSKPAFYWDSEVTGFGLKVGGKSKSYIFQGRVGRKTIRIKIGDVKNWKLKEAKDLAKKYTVQCNEGINPKYEKIRKIEESEKKDALAKKQNIRFEDAWKLYLHEQKSSWKARTYQDHIDMSRGGYNPLNNKTYKPQPIYEFLEIKLSDLNKEFIIEWLQRNNKIRPTSTSKSYRMIRAFLNWCEEEEHFRGIIPKDSYTSKKIKKDVQKTKAKKDCLLKEQIKPLFEEINKISNKKIAFMYQFALLTGARKTEILTLEWKKIDFRWKTIHLRDKNDKAGRTIPMTKHIEKLLKDLKNNNNDDSPYVMSSLKSKTGHIVNPYKDLSKIRKKLQITITLHGFRRSFETLSGWIKLPKGITHQISGHAADSITEKHYTVRPMDMLRMHMQGYEEWFLSNTI